jgi:diguanylate cyclase (GGDEF)-like protein
MPERKLAEGTYIELVKSLFSTLPPTLIMAISFVAIGVAIDVEVSDTPLAILTTLGTIGAFGRILVLLVHRRAARQEGLSFALARRLERRFAISYLFFALVFGAFSARAFVVSSADTRVLIIGLLFGYAAGVTVNLSYRPWISVSAIVIAVIPTLLVTLASSNVAYRWFALLLAVFLAGAIQSMIARYRFASSGITMSRKFATLARIDALTGLPNRLALAEYFSGIAGTRARIALHCLDLDRFKPVNDLYGHPAGDMLLRAVSERLRGLLRQGDFAARLGGDEFVVIQAGVTGPDDAEQLAQRIVRSLAEPYAVGDQMISIGTSLGYCLSSGRRYELESLMEAADQALIHAKSTGGGISNGCQVRRARSLLTQGVAKARSYSHRD